MIDTRIRMTPTALNGHYPEVQAFSGLGQTGSDEPGATSDRQLASMSNAIVATAVVGTMVALAAVGGAVYLITKG